jgi:MFS family permease
MNRNLWLMVAAQGLFFTNNVAFLAINGLVGLSLAPREWMATLPIMGYVLGGALATGPVAWCQSRWGRKASFQIGLVVALLSTLLCAWAVMQRNFWLLVFATVVAGFYSASGQLYRFAAAELSRPEFREKAVSFVLAGGLAGAVLGPNLASWTRNLVEAPFAGAHLALAAAALVGLAVMSVIDFPPEPARSGPGGSGRPLGEIMRQPVFIASVCAAALGFGVMSLLMAATPIAMQHHHHDFDAAALVLEWHVIGMFAPGFFTGHLIKRFGVLPILGAGIGLNLACIAVALSGVDLMQFLVALFLLGVGWNFLFTGGTTLALSAYRPEEKDKAQAAINFWTFVAMALSSFFSGALVTTQGWTLLNVGSLGVVAVTAAVVGWFAWYERGRRMAGAVAKQA